MHLPDLTTIQISNGEIAYRTAGEGIPLVLLHGLAGNSRSWINQFDQFANTNQVIAWDAPGYGGSGDFEPDVDVFTDALNELTTSLSLSRFFLLGHSMGGVLAGRYASRFPEQLLGLILSCTHVGSGAAKGSDLPAGYQSRVNDLNTMSQKDYGISRAAAMLAPNTPTDIFEMAADISGETRATGLANAARVITETDNSKSLAALLLPTLVISGEVDPVVSRDKTDKLVDLVRNAKSATISDAGHAPYLEKPEEYNDAMKSFLAP